MISVLTILAPLVVVMLTGSLVTERMFSIPGVGQLLVEGIQSNDYNVIAALAFIFSALYISSMLLVDILYGIIDPRVRLAGVQ
jgi:oligopeptide transport system permease protein